MKTIHISLKVNGDEVKRKVDVGKTLLEFLRRDLGLTGAKDSCGGEGECGACTVLLDGRPVNSCLVMIGQADGREIVTIEGLARDGQLHPIQKAFIDAGAVQCGYCTPGAILSTYALLQRNPMPREEEIREALSGNLCRCTGYWKMVEAVRMASGEVAHGQ